MKETNQKNNLNNIKEFKLNLDQTHKDYKIDVPGFIIELRKIMNRTIDQFVCDMGWMNEKYYSKIVNGYVCKKEKIKKHSNPTIDYLFGGLNYAFDNNELYAKRKKEIMDLIFKYFFKSF